MDFGNLREKSVKVGNDKKLYTFTENFRGIQLAVVIMTTAKGMHSMFSGRHPKLFIISNLYRVLTEIAEVQTDIGNQ